MEKITFCIPSKDNLRYLKTCIPSIRKNAYRKDHNIIVFVDQDNDGTVKWLDEAKREYNLKFIMNPNLNKERYGIGKAYDRCIKEANTDIVMIFHADMMLGKNADLEAFKHLDRKTAVSATRVEPPLHPNGGEKILRDFGMWPEEFKEEAFDKFVDVEGKTDKVTNGIFAPWMVYKEDFLAIGGHDARMHSCREDSDVFNRMMLDGWDFKQVWSSLVYHLTGRGAGSFSGDEQRHEEWKREMNNSTLEFIRKWGSNVEHTPLMQPIVTPVYRKILHLVDATEQTLEALEPWFTEVAINTSNFNINEWVANKNKNSYIDISERVYEFKNDRGAFDGVHVTLNASKMTQQDFNNVMLLNKIFADSGKPGSFNLGNLIIKIDQLKDISKELIKV